MQDWLTQTAKPICQQSLAAAKAHQASLTKPPGSLGRLESLAEQFAGWQAVVQPQLQKICVRVYAADHGVCAQGVSAFPQIVTTQMIANFVSGGAAISVLSKQMGADFAVINMGTATPAAINQVMAVNLMPGTHDFTVEAAMPAEVLAAALAAGRQQVFEQKDNAHLFIGGEMGIGNTTSASAIYCALLKLTPEQAVGRGTGVDSAGIVRKQQAVQQGLSRHAEVLDNPYEVLRCLGGLEIAALTGSYISCAQQGIPVLVDGFITTAAALLAVRLNPSVKDWLLFSHQSAEQAHSQALDSFQARPLLNLQLCLGEGSGAAVAVSLIQTAIALHNGMATFDQAGVSES